MLYLFHDHISLKKDCAYGVKGKVQHKMPSLKARGKKLQISRLSVHQQAARTPGADLQRRDPDCTENLMFNSSVS